MLGCTPSGGECLGVPHQMVVAAAAAGERKHHQFKYYGESSCTPFSHWENSSH
jgi:hypothetical protein